MDEARRSVRKLLDFGIETVGCYHSGVCRGQIRKQLERMARSMASPPRFRARLIHG
ncbi:hypothetical protein [Geobacillus subterraneus]|uniref:hypothetical protein n=1 Tax=Geobacillus subterraneus TaxID=129338 RepID=UPI000A522C8B|nr:hypothetical protein [Geobacillus subterraneus]